MHIHTYPYMYYLHFRTPAIKYRMEYPISVGWLPVCVYALVSIVLLFSLCSNKSHVVIVFTVLFNAIHVAVVVDVAVAIVLVADNVRDDAALSSAGFVNFRLVLF